MNASLRTAPSWQPGIEWWRSDAAYEHRCADYLAHMLWHSDGPWDVYHAGREPSYPAIWFYETRGDQPVWIECKAPTHLRDYVRAYPERLNTAARALVE